MLFFLSAEFLLAMIAAPALCFADSFAERIDLKSGESEKEHMLLDFTGVYAQKVYSPTGEPFEFLLFPKSFADSATAIWTAGAKLESKSLKI